MQIIRKTIGFLWALWGGIWFISIVALFTCIYWVLFLFTGDKYVRHCIWINCRYLCNIILVFTLVRKRVFGKEHLDKNSTYVYVANHTTQLDAVMAGSSVPHPVTFIAKKELQKIPFFGRMVEMLAFMVDRKDKKSREQTYRIMAEELNKGHSLFLFPEGTRNRTENPLIDFKNGAFKAAILSQKPIVVLTLLGMKRVNEAKGIQLLPGCVEGHFSKPIPTAGMTINDLEHLKDLVRQEMLSHLNG